MRDPNRIKPLLMALVDVWQRFPDWRLGQIIENADITFFTEDEDAERKLREMLERFG